MTSRIQKFGDGLKVQEGYDTFCGETVNVDTISVDLSSYTSAKVAIDNIDSYEAKPGQILRVGQYGCLEYADPTIALLIGDEELRNEYPSLQIAHDKVLESLEEYELVKKLVQDYDK